MNRASFLSMIAASPLINLPIPPRAAARLGTWGFCDLGQGLDPQDKIHNVLVGLIEQKTGTRPTVLHVAHSGATIGFGKDGHPPVSYVAVQAWWPREIPEFNPTLLDQCCLVEELFPDASFDAIVLSGGINDVNVSTIFNPATSPHQIAAATTEYCQNAMQRLLGEIHRRFVVRTPSTRVYVLGYYPVLSQFSTVPDLRDLVRALTNQDVPIPPEVQSYVRTALIRNSVEFYGDSSIALQAAVQQTNARFSSKAFYFVDPGSPKMRPHLLRTLTFGI
jgi:hypothetical protein